MAKLSKTSPATYQIGQWVRIAFGSGKVDAQVIEDRGNIGLGGRHLFAVSVPMEPSDSLTLELPESELEPVNEPEMKMDGGKIIKFLKDGGLVAILSTNISGGRNQPRIWLRLDSHQNVTYTFSAVPGGMGGATVPFWTLQGDKIFTPKVAEVREYLRTFGLTAGEAQDVIEAIGVAP